MKKILITGAGGFVGSRILQQWQGKYELCALPKGFFCTADEALTRAQVEALHPDVILHTAALSDTSYCAQHPAEAYRANVELQVKHLRPIQAGSRAACAGALPGLGPSACQLDV